MRKHILILILIGLGVYYFGFHKSTLDKLLKPLPVASAQATGVRFVEPDYSRRPIEDKQYAESGQITIVYYHLESCPGCRRLDDDLNELLRVRPDVAVRKISLAGDWSTEGTLRDFGRTMGQTPFIVIYGPNRKVLAEDHDRNGRAYNLLYNWINTELEREWKKNNQG